MIPHHPSAIVSSRLIVEDRLPGIKNVKALQSMMRLVGKNAPLELKRKLEVGATDNLPTFTSRAYCYVWRIVFTVDKRAAHFYHAIIFYLFCGSCGLCQQPVIRMHQISSVYREQNGMSVQV